MVHDRGTAFLIDTATELRLQAVAVGLERIDAILMTHAHADHTGGFDDLRRFNELANRHLPVYADGATARSLQERYAYTFVDQYPFYGGKPDLTLHGFDGPFVVGESTIVPVPIKHGRATIHGFRFGALAYVTDAKEVPPASRDLLRGLDVLVLNALRPRPHPTHLSLSEAVELIEALAPKRAYLTHISHELGHAATNALLPSGIEVAYDGLSVAASEP